MTLNIYISVRYVCKKESRGINFYVDTKKNKQFIIDLIPDSEDEQQWVFSLKEKISLSKNLMSWLEHKLVAVSIQESTSISDNLFYF